jgi:BMFP domain-containing protein YqiC
MAGKLRLPAGRVKAAARHLAAIKGNAHSTAKARRFGRMEIAMTQTSNRMFDEFARLMTDAASVAQGVKREAETVFRSQAERLIAELDLVKREDFEVVREMASKARAENEALKARIAALEAKLSGEDAKTAGPEMG